MYGILRTIIILFFILLNKPNFFSLGWGVFVVLFSLYSTFFCDNPVRSLFGDIHIGGGALDIIFAVFYPTLIGIIKRYLCMGHYLYQY